MVFVEADIALEDFVLESPAVRRPSRKKHLNLKNDSSAFQSLLAWGTQDQEEEEAECEWEVQGEVQEESCSESGLDSSSSKEEEAVEEREAEEVAQLEVEEVKEVVLGGKGEAQKTRQFVFSQRSHAAQQDKRRLSVRMWQLMKKAQEEQRKNRRRQQLRDGLSRDFPDTWSSLATRKPPFCLYAQRSSNVRTQPADARRRRGGSGFPSYDHSASGVGEFGESCDFSGGTMHNIYGDAAFAKWPNCVREERPKHVVLREDQEEATASIGSCVGVSLVRRPGGRVEEETFHLTLGSQAPSSYGVPCPFVHA